MGHAQIQTTMVYIQLSPRDVWEQYARAVAQHIRPVPTTTMRIKKLAFPSHPLTKFFQASRGICIYLAE